MRRDERDRHEQDEDREPDDRHAVMDEAAKRELELAAAAGVAVEPALGLRADRPVGGVFGRGGAVRRADVPLWLRRAGDVSHNGSSDREPRT